MAEARNATHVERVDEFVECHDPKKDFLTAWRKAAFRRYFITRNLIRNGLWPTSLWNLGVTVALFSILLLGDWEWAQPINSRLYYIGEIFHIHDELPFLLRDVIISFVSGVVFFIILMYVRRWLLRILLSYHGWMYEMPHQQSKSTMAWGLLVRIISGSSPSTYMCQKSLPYLPLPNLQDTLTGFLQSIKPIYPEGSLQYEKFRDGAKRFQNGLGPKLQKILYLKTWWAQNYVTDWWEKYVYLMGRTPISINSNYYVLDHSYWKPTSRQISRAASTIYQLVSVKRQIERQQMKPLLIRNTIPLCMAQYERVFGTCRVPGLERDSLVTCISKHVSVMHRGVYYKLDILDSAGNPLTPQSLEKQLQWIKDDAEKHYGEYNQSAKSLAALTGIERGNWAKVRAEHFSSGINKESLQVIESSAFHVILDTTSHKTWSESGKYLMHGDGTNIWFDKSFNVIVFTDGKQGLNAEHAWGDAPVMAHCSEYNLTKEVIEGLYDEEGFCLEDKDIMYEQASLKTPARLVWDVSPALQVSVNSAIAFNIANNDDLNLAVVDHKAYGKGFIKSCKVSPDAYIQVALQLTYYKASGGKFALTYESSMTRLYLLGRTETVRSLTLFAVQFIKAMTENERDKDQCIRLLRQACNAHQQLYRDAMNGKGIDRHLFALYVVSKGLGYSSDFLTEALTMPWTLSTSQQPQQQIAGSPDCNIPQFQDKICPGGGFGPVSDQGYGVSYMVPGDHHIFFHVSSKRSCKETDSEKFVQLLFESLDEMKQIFEMDSNGVDH